MFLLNDVCQFTGAVDGETFCLCVSEINSFYKANDDLKKETECEDVRTVIIHSRSYRLIVREHIREVAQIIDDARHGNLFALIELTTDRIAFGPVAEIETDTRTVILLDESRADNSRALFTASFDEALVFTSRNDFDKYLAEHFPMEFAKAPGFNGNPSERAIAG